MMFIGNKRQRLSFTKKRALIEKITRYEREAELASHLQHRLFLSQGSPDERVTMAYRYLPFGSFGGDMFGCLPQSDGRLCFYIADVSGNGVCAAVVSLYLANMLRGEEFSSPSDALYKTREAFIAINDDDRLYVTMFFVMLDPDSGELTWANAGLSTVPLLAHKDSLTRLYAPGLPLCNWENDAKYKDNKTVMDEGARLLLYTDGLFDTKSGRLTEEALETRMLEMEGGTLLSNLESEAMPNRRDDICMLFIKRQAPV